MRSDTMRFTPDDEISWIFRKIFLMHTFSVEIGSVDPASWKWVQVFLKICIEESYSREWSHRRHDHFRTIAVDSIRWCDDMSDTVPVSRTDNSSKISRIADAIEDECQFRWFLSFLLRQEPCSHAHHDKSEIIVRKGTDFFETIFSYNFIRKCILSLARKKSFDNLEIRREKLLYPLSPFNEKASWDFPSDFIMETFDILDFSFGKHKEIIEISRKKSKKNKTLTFINFA